jgi:uncharacterized membrane protein
MDLEMIKQFIKPEILILVPVLYFIGVMIKNTLLIKDKFIPLTLGITGIVLAVIWVLATTDINNAKDIYMAVFTAITQGILCSGASVYVNQIIKQSQKRE